jgi:hypothetical protein
MLRKMNISKRVVLATGLAFPLLISIGAENYPNWKFIASLIGFLGFVLLLIFDLSMQKVKAKADSNK